MKKILTISILIAAMLCTGLGATAQNRYGVIGGFSFSQASEVGNRGTTTRYNAGVTYQLKLPMGFSIQPSLMYHSKGVRAGRIADLPGTNMDLTIGYLELPVSFQWGPDLLLFRPFLDVTPYIGVGLNNKISCKGAAEAESFTGKNIWQAAGVSRMEYGLGVGIGVEIWRFQIIGRYNWNFGSLYRDNPNIDTASQAAWFMENAFGEGGNFKGLTLSVSFLF